MFVSIAIDIFSYFSRSNNKIFKNNRIFLTVGIFMKVPDKVECNATVVQKTLCTNAPSDAKYWAGKFQARIKEMSLSDSSRKF